MLIDSLKYQRGLRKSTGRVSLLSEAIRSNEERFYPLWIFNPSVAVFSPSIFQIRARSNYISFALTFSFAFDSQLIFRSVSIVYNTWISDLFGGSHKTYHLHRYLKFGGWLDDWLMIFKNPYQSCKAWLVRRHEFAWWWNILVEDGFAHMIDKSESRWSFGNS